MEQLVRCITGGRSGQTVDHDHRTRAEVRGRPGIIVSGVAQGFSPDTIVYPWFKLPGHTSYRQGASRISIDESGELTWQRRTGKKIYIRCAAPTVSPLESPHHRPPLMSARSGQRRVI